MSLPAKRLVAEGAPVAAILFFWTVLSLLPGIWLVEEVVRDAGVVMAALYVVVRGVTLWGSVEPPESTDLEAVLRDNARIAVPASVWFLGGAALRLVQDGILRIGILDEISGAFAGAGLGVVGIYAVAVGVAAVGREGASSATLADD